MAHIVVNLDVMLARRKMRSRELAERVGITEANLSLLKSGKVKGVRFETLEKICAYLHCQPGDLLANRAFTLKMLLLFVAGSNAAMFHARQSLDKMDRAARLHMIVSTVVWVAIIALGRWIAYV